MSTIDVDDLAQIIRQVDGDRDLGAGALAEVILDRLPTPQIMPDLPEPQFAQDGTPYWQAAGEVYQPSLTPGFIYGMDASGETFHASVEDIKEKSLAMLAVANYVERNQA